MAVNSHFARAWLYKYILAALILIVSALSSKASDVDDIPLFRTESDAILTFESIPYSLLFSYGNVDDKCKKSIEKYEMSAGLAQLGLHSAVELGIDALAVGRLEDKMFERRHYLRGCPNLIFYRNKVPISYDGENLQMTFALDEISQWIRANMQSHVKALTDETFEHLTQASTGATTGDWFVWFHLPSCSEAKMVWEAVASRLRYSKVVGEVDTSTSPKIQERFNIRDCQTFVLFRQGKMYKYTGDAYDVHALANFAEISFKNFKSEVIKPPPSPFDSLIEDANVFLKESPYGLLILALVTFTLFAGIIFLVCKESKTLSQSEKND